jgi:hypothetical protein
MKAGLLALLICCSIVSQAHADFDPERIAPPGEVNFYSYF